MSIHEEDPFNPNPEWIDWVLTRLTIKHITDLPGTYVGRVALIETEVLDSWSNQVSVGEKTNHTVPLIPNTSMSHLDDQLRIFACLDKGMPLEIGDTFLVATYYHDSPDGMSRATVTSQWEEELLRSSQPS